MLIANLKLSLQPGHLCNYDAKPATLVQIQKYCNPSEKLKWGENRNSQES